MQLQIPTIEPLKIGLEAIQRANDTYEKWTLVVNEMIDTSFGIPNFDLGLINTIITLLEKTYNDNDKVIEWWIWDNNFGKDLQKEDGMWDAEGNPIHLRNIEELYTALIKLNFKG